MMLTKKTIR